MEALVEFEYEAEQEDELTLKVGDVVKNVVTAEGGWWEGELNGKKGMFPENFVKLKTKDKPKEEKREAAQRKSVRELASKFKDGVPLPGAQGAAMQKRKEPGKVKKCKVMFDYTAENEDELSLTLGQVVDFIKEVEEGWWEGTLNGKTGVFPSNFVEMLEDVLTEGDPAAAAAGDGTKSTSGGAGEPEANFHEIKGKKVMGVGLGNIFQGGPIQLRNVGKLPKPDPNETKEPKLPASNPPDVSKREKQATIERAVVRYSYTAEQPDELSLKEGEIIRVLDKHLEDEGWWRGEANGKTGVFPDNFVDLLPAQEEPAKAPKKPPPPVGKNMYPKLPDKAPSVEEKTTTVKKEPEPAVEKPVPPGASKKPIFPPPIGRKPGASVKTSEPPPKPEPPRPVEPVVKVEMRHKDPGSNHHGPPSENNHVQEVEETNLDVVEPSSGKLVHLTANRAKGPKKRPPSTVLSSSEILDKVEAETEDSSTKGSNHIQPQKPPPPVTKEAKHISPPDMERSYRQSSLPESQEGQGSHTSSAPPRPPEPVRHQEAGPDTSALTRLVEDLQREVRDLRSNSVSRNDYNDLRSDLQRLKQEMDTFKASHSKKLRDLMMEVDEEKKLRLNAQVEMERVKKLLAESNV